MADKKEVFMAQAVFAFAQGCGGADVDPNAFEWFVDRYSNWLGSTPAKALGQKPLDVLGEQGQLFLGRFQEIGRRAVQYGATVGTDSLSKAALAVEKESACPFCPDI